MNGGNVECLIDIKPDIVTNILQIKNAFPSPHPYKSILNLVNYLFLDLAMNSGN